MKRTVIKILISFMFISCGSSKNIVKMDKLDLLLSNNIKSGSNIEIDKGTYKLDTPIKLMGKENVVINGNSSTFIMKYGI